MILNVKCKDCPEPTKFVTGFWDGKDETHGCLYDCKNTDCIIKALMDAAATQIAQEQAKIQEVNGENGIYAGKLAALRRDAHVSTRKMAEIAGCGVAEYSAYEHERKLFPIDIYQTCMEYVKRKGPCKC